MLGVTTERKGLRTPATRTGIIKKLVKSPTLTAEWEQKLKQVERGELDSIYERFNLNHPEDYRGHSSSISDIVWLHKDALCAGVGCLH